MAGIDFFPALPAGVLGAGLILLRSAQSASTVMSGTEQTLYEVSSTTVFQFGGGSVLIPASDTAAFTIRVYIKNKSGGSYIDITPVSALALQGSYVLIGPGLSERDNNTPRISTPAFNRYGYKITLEQTAVGAGYVTVDAEFFDTVGT